MKIERLTDKRYRFYPTTGKCYDLCFSNFCRQWWLWDDWGQGVARRNKILTNNKYEMRMLEPVIEYAEDKINEMIIKYK